MVNAREPTLWRLFVALWPEPAVRAAITGWLQGWTWPTGASLVAPERLHLTLHFLGDVPAARVPSVAVALHVPFEPVELRFGRAEVWPGGVAVLRPTATPPALLALHARLAAAIAALELPVERRPYKAHVTLARRAQQAMPPRDGPAFDWRAEAGFVLVRTLRGGGYEVLRRFS